VTLWHVGVERQVESPDGGIINDPVLLRLAENRFSLSLADSDVLHWALGVAHTALGST
jgi:hypothetical protein